MRFLPQASWGPSQRMCVQLNTGARVFGLLIGPLHLGMSTCVPLGEPPYGWEQACSQQLLGM
jgi:hypothetical protein